MPELPEVETVRRGLAPAMEGAVISKAEVNRPDLRWPFPDRMADRLTGRTVQALRRRSKYILADLSGGETLILHLGMSGRILISGDPLGQFHHQHPAPEKHDHVVFDMSNGARITFNDARRFGAMDLGATADIETHKMLAGLGAPAIATSSAAHAFTLGRPDGGHVTRDEALAHSQDLVAAVSIPVSGDFENGFVLFRLGLGNEAGGEEG